ncbi:MAG: hypothetical protein V4584_11435 [Verrucomicrobiota bacterium]
MLACNPLVAEAWEPGTYPAPPARMYAAGFDVDNYDRNDVVAFWHAVYQASEGYESRVNWTGNYTGNNGTVSGPFLDDVERRLNYFRAMCGLDANASVNSGSTVSIDLIDPFKPGSSTTKAVAAQNASLMMIRNFNSSTGANPALTHDPASGLTGWSASAWNAAAKGNFAFGLYGPGAITEYMIEALASNSATSPWNSLVGHRRWCLYPESTDFATGDQPGSGPTRPPTNVFYVSQKPAELLAIRVPNFVTYPAAGFFPAPVNSPFWSISRQGANFSSASVRVTDASGKAVPVSNVRANSNYGDPALVWQVGPAAATASVYNDTTFKVDVSGISGIGVPATHSYSVTLINPDRITSSHNIVGAAQVAAGKSAVYTFLPPAGAEGIQVVSSIKRSTLWTETAENAAKAKVIDGTAANYPLIVKTASFAGFGAVKGASAFHLTFPTSYDVLKRGVPEQFFEIDRELIAKSKAKLNFSYRRGFMTKTSVLVVETSSNGGVTWNTIGSPIKGLSDTKYDTKVSLVSIPLAKSATPFRIRFRYYASKTGSIYTHEAAPKSPTGIFIDDVTVTKCDWLETKKANALSASSRQFSLSTKTAGNLVKGDQWHLRLRTKLGGKWFPLGPPKAVTVTGP